MPYAKRACASCGVAFQPRHDTDRCPACREIQPRTHLVIPDCQVKPGVNTDHLEWAGKFIADKRPDVIICIGDFADMSSLSTYDVGKKSFEGRSYRRDIVAAKSGMARLMGPFVDIPDYHPRLVMTLGNHEERILRAVEADRKLEDLMSIDDLGYEAWGWEVHPFLEIVEIDGIEYSHYFTTGVMGRPVSSAKALLGVRMGSATMGHVQLRDTAIHQKTNKRALFAGIFYTHEEAYLGLQGNTTQPQLIVKHEVRDGEYDLMEVSLNFLRRKYGDPK